MMTWALKRRDGRPGARRRLALAGFVLTSIGFASLPAAGCSAMSIGDPESSIGQKMFMTYDVNRDESCGGALRFDAPRVTTPPKFGAVALIGKRFRYVTRITNTQPDNFVISGLHNNKPARMRVVITFQ